MFCKLCSEKSKQFQAMRIPYGADFRQKWLEVFNSDFPNWMCATCEQQMGNKSLNDLVSERNQVLEQNSTDVATTHIVAVNSTEIAAVKQTKITDVEIIDILDEEPKKITAAAATTTTETAMATIRKPDASANKIIPSRKNNYAGALKKFENHYECTLCIESKRYTYKTSAAYHIKNKHLAQKPLECTLCEKNTKFRNSKELSVHIKIYHSGYRFICNICDFSYYSKISLRHHFRKSHSKQPKPIFRFEIPQKIDFTKSIKTFPKYYQCAHCKYTNQHHSNGLLAHIMTKHYGYYYTCNHCEKSYVNYSCIRKHLKIDHENSDANAFKILKPSKLQEVDGDEDDVSAEDSMEFFDHSDSAEIKQEELQFEEYSFSYVTIADEPMPIDSKNKSDDDCPSTSQTSKDQTSRPILFVQEPSDKQATKAKQSVSSSLQYARLKRRKILFKYSKAYSSSGKSYHCKLCMKSRKFFQFSTIRRHIKFQHFSIKFQCTKCAKQLAQPTKLRKHYAAQHGINGPNKLQLCLFTKSNQANKPKQISKLQRKNVFKLSNEITDALQANKEQSQEHSSALEKLQPHDNDNNTGCKELTLLPKQRSNAKSKQRCNFSTSIRKVGNSYECVLCEFSKQYCNTMSVRSHIKYKHYGYRYICQECECHYASRNGVERHLEQMHDIIDNVNAFRIGMTVKIQNGNGEETREALQNIKEQPLKKLQQQDNVLVPNDIGCKSALAPQQQNSGRQVVKQRCNFSTSIRKVGNSYECVLCKFSKQYRNTMSVRSHIKYKHYGYRYICKKCESHYASRNGVERHLKEKHNITDNANAFKIGIPAKIKKRSVEENSVADKWSAVNDGNSQNLDYSITESENSLTAQHQPCQSTSKKSEASVELQYQPFQSTSCLRSLNYASAAMGSEISLKIQNCQSKAPAIQEPLTSFKPSQAAREFSIKQENSKSTNSQHLSNVAASSESMALIKLEHQPCQKNDLANLESGDSLQLRQQTKNSQHVASLQSLQTYKMEKNFEARITQFKYSTAYKRSGNSYLCKLCIKSRKFFQFSAIRRHIKFQHFTLSFQCTNCTEQLAQPSKLRKHYAQQHGTKGPDKLNTIFKINKIKRKITENQMKHNDIGQVKHATDYKKSNEFAENVAIKQEQIDISKYSLNIPFSQETSSHPSEQHYVATSQNVYALPNISQHLAEDMNADHQFEFSHKVIKQEKIDFNEYSISYAKSEHNSTSSRISNEFLDEDVTTSSSFQQSSNASFVLPNGIDDQQLQFSNKANKKEFDFNQDFLGCNNSAEQIPMTIILAKETTNSLSAQNSTMSLELANNVSQQLEFSSKPIKQEEFVFKQDYLSCDNPAGSNPNSNLFISKAEHDWTTMPGCHQPEQYISATQGCRDNFKQFQISHEAIKQEEFDFKQNSSSYDVIDGRNLILTSVEAGQSLSAKANWNQQEQYTTITRNTIASSDKEFIKQEEFTISEYSLNYDAARNNASVMTASKAELQHQSSKAAFKYSMAYKKNGNSFCCKLCFKSRKFFQFSAIRQHIKFQHFTLRFQCIDCPKHLAQSAQLRRHCSQQHGTHGPDKLKTVFLRNSQLEKIIRVLSKGKPKKAKNNKTNQQQFGTRQSREIVDMQKSSDPTIEYEQTGCKLFQFMEKVQNYFHCKLCKEKSKKYSNTQNLRVHININHYGYRYICRKCDATFRTREAAQKHFMKMHGVIKQQDYKQEISQSPLYLARRIREERAAMYTFEVPKTKNNEKLRPNLIQFIEKVENYLRCGLCKESKKYYCGQVLRVHIKMDHLGYRYICNECNLTFTSRYRTKSHCEQAHQIQATFKMDIPKSKRCEEYSMENSKQLSIDSIQQPEHLFPSTSQKALESLDFATTTICSQGDQSQLYPSNSYMNSL